MTVATNHNNQTLGMHHLTDFTLYRPEHSYTTRRNTGLTCDSHRHCSTCPLTTLTPLSLFIHFSHSKDNYSQSTTTHVHHYAPLPVREQLFCFHLTLSDYTFHLSQEYGWFPHHANNSNDQSLRDNGHRAIILFLSADTDIRSKLHLQGQILSLLFPRT